MLIAIEFLLFWVYTFIKNYNLELHIIMLTVITLAMAEYALII